MSEKKYYCLSETYKHVKKVQSNINLFVTNLIHRAEVHDASKFEEPELSIFAENTHKLGITEYGSDEYKKLMLEVRPAITHHYSKNDHHPEFHKNGIDDMDLMQICEMLADWKAATERNKDGNIRKSIEINSEKYNISPQLRRILENTIKKYF
jgi:hypothetical protein